VLECHPPGMQLEGDKKRPGLRLEVQCGQRIKSFPHAPSRRNILPAPHKGIMQGGRGYGLLRFRSAESCCIRAVAFAWSADGGPDLVPQHG
jgi:hypothetical protein